MNKKIFVNLPVKDLQRSIDFFSKLGFSFDPQFTDDNATCMIIDDNIFAMLLVEDFFKSFTGKEICDTEKANEALIALSFESRDAIDDIVNRAKAAGGSIPNDPMDHGWMYQWAFLDLDGHRWEPIYTDETSDA